MASSTTCVWHPDGFVMAVTSGQPGNGRLSSSGPATRSRS